MQFAMQYVEPCYMETLIMPRRPAADGDTADAQLTFRAEQRLKTELEACAKTLDRSSAKLLRDILADALPALRKKADAERDQRDKLPHGITPDVLERAMNSVLRKWGSGEPIHLELSQLL